MRIANGIILLFLLITAFVVGMFAADVPTSGMLSVSDAPTYSSGYYDEAFYDRAYDRASGQPVAGVTSALVAHHLLIADKIANVFEVAASDDVRTVVLVSPNHFSIGSTAMQVSRGSWSTPYGRVDADTEAIATLLTAVPELRHDEFTAPHEHGIGGLTPYVVRSFPNARLVPIMLDESLPADTAWKLGEAIATQLPDAILIASVDMTHNQTAEYTAANDERVLALIERAGWCDGAVCTDNLDVDSNASLRTLFGFNAQQGGPTWHFTHHGSSLAMGATLDWRENTSHILGYFTKDE